MQKRQKMKHCRIWPMRFKAVSLHCRLPGSAIYVRERGIRLINISEKKIAEIILK